MDIPFRKIIERGSPWTLYQKGERFAAGAMTFAMLAGGSIAGYGIHLAANGDILGYPLISAGAVSAGLTYLSSWNFNDRIEYINRYFSEKTSGSL